MTKIGMLKGIADTLSDPSDNKDTADGKYISDDNDASDNKYANDSIDKRHDGMQQDTSDRKDQGRDGMQQQHTTRQQRGRGDLSETTGSDTTATQKGPLVKVKGRAVEEGAKDDATWATELLQEAVQAQGESLMDDDDRNEEAGRDGGDAMHGLDNHGHTSSDTTTDATIGTTTIDAGRDVVRDVDRDVDRDDTMRAGNAQTSGTKESVTQNKMSRENKMSGQNKRPTRRHGTRVVVCGGTTVSDCI